MDTVDLRASRIAAPQRGLALRRQLLDAGISGRTIARRVRAGTWIERVAPVIELPAWPETWERAVLRAVLAAGPGAVASHRTAAHLWGFLDVERPALIDVLTPREGRYLSGDALMHTTIRLPAEDVTRVDGIPVTARHRTLVDYGGVVPFPQLELATLDYLRRPDADRGALIAAAEARQVPGGRAVVNALIRAPRGAERLESPLEVRIVPFLRAHKLPMPTFQYEIRGPDGRLVARLDGAWVAQRVALEGDSIWHDSGHAQANDRARDAFLASMAWEVIRLRRGDLHGPRGQAKADEIRQALGI
jgi:hypothetical protein